MLHVGQAALDPSNEHHAAEPDVHPMLHRCINIRSVSRTLEQTKAARYAKLV
jgi:hypothetical protein